MLDNHRDPGPSGLERLDVEGHCEKEKKVKLSAKDQVKGMLHELKGKAKEKVGQLTNNPDLAAEGQNEKVTGKIQKKVGQIEQVFEK
jgi:uncharacterized protein YjbJ (UPF0337 family)